MDMQRQEHVRLLQELIKGCWTTRSTSVHSRIEELRALINHLGHPYGSLDIIAAEIETVSGTALGMGYDFLDEESEKALLKLLGELRSKLKATETRIKSS